MVHIYSAHKMHQFLHESCRNWCVFHVLGKMHFPPLNVCAGNRCNSAHKECSSFQCKKQIQKVHSTGWHSMCSAALACAQNCWCWACMWFLPNLQCIPMHTKNLPSPTMWYSSSVWATGMSILAALVRNWCEMCTRFYTQCTVQGDSKCANLHQSAQAYEIKF